MTTQAEPSPSENSLLSSLQQSQELMARSGAYNANNLTEFRALWEHTTELLGQAYPKFQVVAQLAKAVSSYVLYAGSNNPRADLVQYLSTQVRAAEKALNRYNEFAEDDDEVILVPEYSIEVPEAESGARDLEALAVQIGKSYPLFPKLMAASLQTGLVGHTRKLAMALSTLEATCYIFPPPKLPAYILTLTGDPIEKTEAEVNALFLEADRILQVNYSGWCLLQNLQVLEEWIGVLKELTGYPLGFEYIGSVTPLGRISYWIKALDLGNWEGIAMVQSLKMPT